MTTARRRGRKVLSFSVISVKKCVFPYTYISGFRKKYVMEGDKE